MNTQIKPARPGSLAWLALSGLAGIAFVLGGGVGVALQAEQWGTLPRRFVDACLLIPPSVAGASWSWMITHPLTALVLAFLAASLVWALLRQGLSLWGGWRVKRRRRFFRFPIVVLVLVWLILSTCFTALVEAGLHTYQVCVAVTGEELTTTKAPFPGLWVAPIESRILPFGPSQSECSPLESTPDVVSADLWGNLSSRAPPVLR